MKFYGNVPMYGAPVGGARTGMHRIRMAPRSVPRIGPSMDATVIEMEGNVERLMRERRAAAYPYLQGKAQDLLNRSNIINGELGPLQTQLTPTLSSWATLLRSRKSELEDFSDDLRRIGTGTTMVVLDWILTFGGTLKTSITGTKREAEAALQEVEAAIGTVTSRISALQSYINNLSKRQKTSQLSMWASGTNLKNMSEEVARSFGVDQRELLQGWWDEGYLEDWRAIGDKKPWQPSCDLYQRRITPRSWREIDAERAMAAGGEPGAPPVGWGAYGSTAGGTLSGDKYVYFRQPRPGQEGYRDLRLHKNPRTDPWSKRLLENGCVAGAPCPVFPATSPIKTTLDLIRIQTYGMNLMLNSWINNEIAAIDSALNRARSKLDRGKDKFRALKFAVWGAGKAVKPKIKLGLEATGGPTALRSGLAGGGAAAGGPIGAIVGWLAGEVALDYAVGKIWDRLTSGVSNDKSKMDRARSNFTPIRDRTKNTARWWKNNTDATWRRARRNEMASIQLKLQRWKVIYNGMKPTIREIYPKRNKFQWRHLGVEECAARAPELEDPGDWRPPAGGVVPWGPSGGGEDRIPSDFKPPPMETLTPGLGSIEGIEPQKHFGLTKNQWLLVGAGAAAFYYYKRKK